MGGGGAKHGRWCSACRRGPSCLGRGEAERGGALRHVADFPRVLRHEDRGAVAVGRRRAAMVGLEGLERRGVLARDPARRVPGRRLELRLDLIFRSEEHTSELQSLMRTSYAVFCLKKKKRQKDNIVIPMMNQDSSVTIVNNSTQQH